MIPYCSKTVVKTPFENEKSVEYSIELGPQEWMDKAVGYWKEAGMGSVIEPMVGPAVESLDKLIAQGEEGKFDFAFIDADKV